MARTLLLVQLFYVNASAALSSPAPEWWAFNGTLIVGLVAWAAGPRGLQYLGPQIAAAGKAIGAAARRLAGTDNRRRDDESG